MKHLSSLYLLLLAALLLATGCNATQQASAQSATPTPTPQNFVSVEVTEVITGPIAQYFSSYAGDLRPQKEVAVMPEAGGQIESVLVEVGDTVAKGDPIAAIEQDTYMAQFRQAQASLRSAQAELRRLEEGSRPAEINAAQAAVEAARAQLSDVVTIDDDERTRAAQQMADARARLRRAQSEYDKIAWAGNIAERPQAIELEQATNAYEAALASYNLQTTPSDSEVAPLMQQLAQAELNLELALNPYRDVDFEAARAAVAQAEAGLELAEIQLENTTIDAPFAGVIAELNIEEGSLASQQQPAAELVSEALEVDVAVEESRIGQIEEGQSAAINAPAFPETDFPATVSNIDPTGDSDTHTFSVTITPRNDDSRLKSGMYIEVALLAEQRDGVPLVPRAAVVQVDGQSTVYVVDQEQIAQQRDVTLGLENEQQVEILSGVEPGERVVVAGQNNLTDGARVELVSGF